MSGAAKPKKVSDHPVYNVMVKDAVVKLESKKISHQKIVKYVCVNYKVDPLRANFQIKSSIKRLIKSGELIQASGVGAAGSYKLNPQKKKVAKSKPKATTQPSKPSSKAKAPVTKLKPTKVKKAKSTPKKSVKKATIKKVVKKPVAKVQKKPAATLAKKVKVPKKKPSPKKKVAKKVTAKKTGKK